MNTIIFTDDERKGDEMLQGMHHQMLGYGIKEEAKRGATDCGVPIPASKPKIWSLADTAACKTPPPAAQPWPQHAYGGVERAPAPDAAAANGFALPATAAASPASGAYARYGGFPGAQYAAQHPCVHPAAFPDVQTDTPPQTPPNMKMPSVANPLGSGGGGGGYCFPRHQHSPHRDPYHNPHHATNNHQPNQPHHNEGSAAFKPFYKRLLYFFFFTSIRLLYLPMWNSSNQFSKRKLHESWRSESVALHTFTD